MLAHGVLLRVWDGGGYTGSMPGEIEDGLRLGDEGNRDPMCARGAEDGKERGVPSVPVGFDEEAAVTTRSERGVNRGLECRLPGRIAGEVPEAVTINDDGEIRCCRNENAAGSDMRHAGDAESADGRGDKKKTKE